jgi:hypothetical protein
MNSLNPLKIALLVPSRERIDKKIELINSIKNTVNDINNITLYFGIDEDDPTKDAVYKIASENPFVKIVMIENNGKFLNLGVLWNKCARASTEEIISMVGDDMVFMTKGWDKEILEEFSSPNCPEDNFKMVYCYDGRHGKKIAVNCFIHRRYMDITGYFMREEFPVDKVDIWLQQIFNAFGRLVYREDIHIEHKHWSFRKSQIDNVAVRMRAGSRETISTQLWSALLPERLMEAEKISRELGIMFYKNLIDNREQHYELVNGGNSKC